MTALRILFLKQSQSWPRASGHDVHGYHMMQALAARGHAISLATIIPPKDEALAGLTLQALYSIGGAATEAETRPTFTRWQRRFLDYFGVEEAWTAALAAVLAKHEFDAVIAVARHLLPLLSVVPSGTRIWYPADDPAWHHVSRMKLLQPGTWGEAKRALANGLYERAFRRNVDRVWVVSPADRRAMRLITGREVDLIPNGVDADYYAPRPGETLPNTCVFWGRLDFGPNLDALAGFLRRVWPTVRRNHPAAMFHVFGFNPTPAVRELARSPGVELFPDLPDLRGEVTRRQAVVLPFVSGGGIKNKLLEAAAMGLPIVCTRQALSGTKGQPAVRVARSPADFSRALGDLWRDASSRAALGAAARSWVLANHTWAAAAITAESAIRAGSVSDGSTTE
jgi:glycosyltransferase involved in cell wall biosynthesis